MSNWINEQMEFNISQFDKAIETHYPESLEFFRNPKEFYRGITELWNYLEAVQIINWNRYLKHNSTILDLGGGTGWLSAYLSKFDSVKDIYILDSNKYFLHNMMPEIVRLMHGKNKKVHPIEGLFSPLLFEDNSLDIVVVCSSLHHAENLENLLKEINRVLKEDGILFILNETPLSNLKYLIAITKIFMSILKNTLFYKYKSASPYISSSGVLYDPYLNDRCYPLWFWKKAIKNSNFYITESMRTSLLTRKADTAGVGLTHFICKKSNDNR